MSDYIIRVTAAEGSIRAFFATTRETANEAQRLHQTSPVVTAALGRMLTAGAIMGTMLKGDDILTLSIKGDGEMRGITVTADSLGRVKGYPINPIVDIPLKQNGKLDVSGAIGEGTLSIIKDIGLKEPYVGMIPLVSGEIAEDLTYYYAKSEQIPTSVALGVLVDRDYSVKQSLGFIIQLMPDATDDAIEKLEDRLRSLPNLTSLMEDGKSIEEIMELIFEGLSPSINETVETSFYCNCSREKVEKALMGIGHEELTDIINEDKKATLHCHFCQKDYEFDETYLRELLSKI